MRTFESRLAARRPKDKDERLFIGLYRRELDKLDNQTDFTSYIGRKKDFTQTVSFKEPWSTSNLSELVDLRRIPAIWVPSMHIAIDYRGYPPEPYQRNVGSLTRLGHIAIRTDKTKKRSVASTIFYFPRSSFDLTWQEWPHNAPGLGYAIEGMMFWSLKDEITHARTGSHPANPRANQLKRAGLPTCKPVPIDQWLEGLLRGFKQSIESAKLAMLLNNYR